MYLLLSVALVGGCIWAYFKWGTKLLGGAPAVPGSGPKGGTTGDPYRGKTPRE